MKTYTCSFCASAREVKACKDGRYILPKKWKLHLNKTLCSGCMQREYVPMTFTFYVASVVSMDPPPDPDPKPAAGDNEAALRWKAAWKIMWEALRESALAHNWVIQRLMELDPVRKSVTAKCTKFVKPDLYKEARLVFPDMLSYTTASIVTYVTQKYKEVRYAARYAFTENVPTFKIPQPLPIPEQNWNARYLSETEKVMLVELSVRGTRFVFRLQGGNDARWQKAAFAHVMNGTAIPRALKVLRRRARKSSHRKVKTENRSNLSAQRQWRLAVDLSVWFPKKERVEGGPELVVSTDPDSFLVFSPKPEDGMQRLNADHVRRWVREHDKRLQRLSDDAKVERRSGSDFNFEERRKAECARHNHRIESFIDQAVAMVCQYARRKRVSSLRWEDAGPGHRMFCRADHQFPWFKFKQRLLQKSAAFNIGFVDKSYNAPVPDEKTSKQIEPGLAPAPTEESESCEPTETR